MFDLSECYGFVDMFVYYDVLSNSKQVPISSTHHKMQARAEAAEKRIQLKQLPKLTGDTLIEKPAKLRLLNITFNALGRAYQNIQSDRHAEAASSR